MTGCHCLIVFWGWVSLWAPCLSKQRTDKRFKGSTGDCSVTSGFNLWPSNTGNAWGYFRTVQIDKNMTFFKCWLTWNMLKKKSSLLSYLITWFNNLIQLFHSPHHLYLRWGLGILSLLWFPEGNQNQVVSFFVFFFSNLDWKRPLTKGC